MSSYSITPASIKDITQLAALVNSAYRGDTARQGWTHEADLIEGNSRTNEADLLQLLQDPNAVILQCHKEGELVGSVYLKKEGPELYLGMLSVSPYRQGAGIGKQLLLAAEAYAKTKGCTAIKMTVISVRSELITWYEKRGYMPTGEREPFPDDAEFGTPRQPLQFIVLKKLLH